MSVPYTIERIKRVSSGVALIAFPLMLLVGFLLHPNFMSLTLVTDADVWAAEFRGSLRFHLGHLLVLLTVPLIMIVGTRCMRFASSTGGWLVFWGGVVGLFGAFILAVDKGALTLVLTAFDSLSDEDLLATYPALQALLDRAGWLWIVQLLLLLPVGFAAQALGLARSGVIGWGQAAVIVVGLLLLLAGDIEIITSVGAGLMCLGYIPMGVRELRGDLGIAPQAA
jgi:hypothetical protein